MLNDFRISEDYMPLMQERMLLTFQEHNESLKETEAALNRQLTDIHIKLDRLEESFITEELMQTSTTGTKLSSRRKQRI